MNYEWADVEALLELMWDPHQHWGPVRDGAPDSDMPKGGSDPRNASTWMAELADIKRAWQRTDLTDVERRRLFMHYGLGWPYAVVGAHEGVNKKTAQESCTRGVSALVDNINARERVAV